MKKTPLQKVIYDHFGGPTATARALTARRQKEAGFNTKITPVSEQNVRYWLNCRVPPMIAKILEIESDGYVSRAELRPDIFE